MINVNKMIFEVFRQSWRCKANGKSKFAAAAAALKCSTTMEKVILAYSGGLDTSCILKWLLDNKYDVICYMANVGQEEDFEKAREKALKIGASEVVIEDVREKFITDYIFPAIQYGLLYESRYLLGTSLARPCISVGLINCAKKFEAKYISHGATGKGNDQVRFELSCYSLWPKVQVIAPWRLKTFTDRFEGRQDLLRYAEQNGIPVPVTVKAPWSMDANLMHISYESGILEDPKQNAPADLYLMTTSPKQAPDKAQRLNVRFKNGSPVAVKDCETDVEYVEPVQMFDFLNKAGGKNGIGRVDIVENRYIGLKSRGIYETPGGTILHEAHKDLQVFCQDKEILRVKQYLTDRLSDIVYNGFWFSPEGTYVRNCISLAQETINGVVELELYKGNVIILGRYADRSSLYNQDLVSMDKHSEFDPSDATGFINIQAIRLKEYNRYINQQQ